MVQKEIRYIPIPCTGKTSKVTLLFFFFFFLLFILILCPSWVVVRRCTLIHDHRLKKKKLNQPTFFFFFTLYFYAVARGPYTHFILLESARCLVFVRYEFMGCPDSFEHADGSSVKRALSLLSLVPSLVMKTCVRPALFKRLLTVIWENLLFLFPRKSFVPRFQSAVGLKNVCIAYIRIRCLPNCASKPTSKCSVDGNWVNVTHPRP